MHTTFIILHLKKIYHIDLCKVNVKVISRSNPEKSIKLSLPYSPVQNRFDPALQYIVYCMVDFVRGYVAVKESG